MRRFILVIMALALTAVFVACGDDLDGKKEGAETVVVKHELGETTVAKNPKKVVVFDFGTLDTLDKLGVEVTALPQSNIPSYLSKFESDDYENVGSLKEPDFEKLAEIDPDLIIISGRQADLYDQFTELADTIYLGVDNNNYMESFENNVTIIGEVFGKEAEAKKEFETIESSIAAVKEKAEAAEVNGLIILANDDKISAYGPNSRFGIIHDLLGVTPVDDGIDVATHGANVSFEYVVEQDPEILYVVDRGTVVGSESSAKVIVENKLMEGTQAFQNDNIVYLNPEYWYLSGGGLVSVAEMVKEIDASIK